MTWHEVMSLYSLFQACRLQQHAHLTGLGVYEAESSFFFTQHGPKTPTASVGACLYQGRTWLCWVLEMIHTFTNSSGISGMLFYSRISDYVVSLQTSPQRKL